MDHGTLRAETTDDGRKTGVCECGWRSTPRDTAEEVGASWDAHRREAAMQEAG
jgi:hypothetical protein